MNITTKFNIGDTVFRLVYTSEGGESIDCPYCDDDGMVTILETGKKTRCQECDGTRQIFTKDSAGFYFIQGDEECGGVVTSINIEVLKYGHYVLDYVIDHVDTVLEEYLYKTRDDAVNAEAKWWKEHDEKK